MGNIVVRLQISAAFARVVGLLCVTRGVSCRTLPVVLLLVLADVDNKLLLRRYTLDTRYNIYNVLF